MLQELEFSVVEIKSLGYGLSRRLSVRFDGAYPGTAKCGGISLEESPASFTIHAVLPYSPEYGTLQIGQKFSLVRVAETMDVLKRSGDGYVVDVPALRKRMS